MEVFPVEVDDDVHVLRAEGGIDARTADGLLEQVGRMIDEGATRIVLDCQDLEIVSSAGLAALLRIHTRLRTRGGDVRLAGVRGTIAQVLQITRLDRIFELHPDVGRAKLSFRPPDA
jgi:anti-sigma B factor antagonist